MINTIVLRFLKLQELRKRQQWECFRHRTASLGGDSSISEMQGKLRII